MKCRGGQPAATVRLCHCSQWLAAGAMVLLAMSLGVLALWSFFGPTVLTMASAAVLLWYGYRRTLRLRAFVEATPTGLLIANYDAEHRVTWNDVLAVDSDADRPPCLRRASLRLTDGRRITLDAFTPRVTCTVGFTAWSATSVELLSNMGRSAPPTVAGRLLRTRRRGH